MFFSILPATCVLVPKIGALFASNGSNESNTDFPPATLAPVEKQTVRALSAFSAAEPSKPEVPQKPGFFSDLVVRGGAASIKMKMQKEPTKGFTGITRQIYMQEAGKGGLKAFYPGVASYYAMSVFNAYFKNKFIDMYTAQFKAAGFGPHSTILATGLLPTITRQTGWIFGYLELLNFGKETLKLDSKQMIAWGMVAGGLAGFLSCPSDVPKSRMQTLRRLIRRSRSIRVVQMQNLI